MDVVTVAEIPDDYESRLIDMKVGGLTHLRLLAFERHDLVLAKLARNSDRDREDVVALAQGPGLDTTLLRARYLDELRPMLGRPDREDLTLELWIEMILEISGQAPTSSAVPSRRMPRCCHDPVAKFVPDTQPIQFKNANLSGPEPLEVLISTDFRER